MRKSSWAVLGVCALLLFGLGFAYMLSRASNDTLTRDQAAQIVQKMQDAVARKDVGTIMNYIDPSPETRVASLNQDQLRIMIGRALHAMKNPRADVSNLAFAGGVDSDATLDFDLDVKNGDTDYNALPYKGHIALHLKRVDVPHLLGLYQTKEWRVVSGSTTGPQLTDMGE